MMFEALLFKKYLGSIADPIANAMNAIINMITRLVDGLFIDKSRKIANNKRTIKGLKMCLFNIMFLFKKLKKFSLG